MKTSTHFFIISRSILLSMKNVSEKLFRGSRNTHFMFSNFINFFPPENPAVYEIMWKNIVERGRPQMTIENDKMKRLNVAFVRSLSVCLSC